LNRTLFIKNLLEESEGLGEYALWGRGFWAGVLLGFWLGFYWLFWRGFCGGLAAIFGGDFRQSCQSFNQMNHGSDDLLAFFCGDIWRRFSPVLTIL